MRRYSLVAIALLVATIGALAALTPAAGAAGAPVVNCATEGGQRWCNSLSVNYPRTIGWYGYVGKGGGPCGTNPRGTTFAEGLVGICVAPAPVEAWRYTSAGWRSTQLSVGTRGYVYPYDHTWRWLYVDGAWHAIRAYDLTLEWRVTG
jgi:hypothetical protein